MKHSTDVVQKWFPDKPYYHNHAPRLAASFSHLPSLTAGFRCLVLGSWGIETPMLVGEMGAGAVTVLRAPEDGLPRHEVLTFKARDREFQCDAWAVDIERDEWPAELGKFDLVMAWEVLEHLNFAPADTLRRAVWTLCEGGNISVTTPNALWWRYTLAQLEGNNALGLRLRLEHPFATHWRLYSPSEIADMLSHFGCEVSLLTSVVATKADSWKSRIAMRAFEYLRRNSGNGAFTSGRHTLVVARKNGPVEDYRPTWLHPGTPPKER